VEEIQNESVNTSTKNIALLTKVGLLIIFLSGLLIRIFVPIVNFQHLANILMSVAVLGRLFMYVRSLNPALFFPKRETFSTLQLIDKKEAVVASYDQRTLTPLERVISDK
jgi:Na+-transporting NADH:ubiquinone oxidoreductase subunit NqrB